MVPNYVVQVKGMKLKHATSNAPGPRDSAAASATVEILSRPGLQLIRHRLDGGRASDDAVPARLAQGVLPLADSRESGC